MEPNNSSSSLDSLSGCVEANSFNNIAESVSSDCSEPSKIEEAKNGIFVHVPQGFYAKITPETPVEVKGLYTTGINTCTCLIVTNEERTHMFLAHVDGLTMNISDESLGLNSWIKEIYRKSYTKNINIKIHYGEEVIDLEGSTYYRTIKDCLEKSGFKSIDGRKFSYKERNIEIVQENDKYCNSTIILRNPLSSLMKLSTSINVPICYCRERVIEEIEKYFLFVENYSVDSWRNATGYKASSSDFSSALESEEADKGGKFLSRFEIVKYKINKKLRITLKTDIPFPPVCCFDGSLKGLKLLITGDSIFGYLDDKYKKVIETYQKKLCHIIRDSPPPHLIQYLSTNLNKELYQRDIGK